jgi:hypothetical protein
MLFAAILVVNMIHPYWAVWCKDGGCSLGKEFASPTDCSRWVKSLDPEGGTWICADASNVNVRK